MRTKPCSQQRPKIFHRLDVHCVKTIAVVIDPNSQFSIDDPHANGMAQRDVEAALLKWGRFQTVSDAQSADLVVVIRKGKSYVAHAKR